MATASEKLGLGAKAEREVNAITDDFAADGAVRVVPIEAADARAAVILPVRAAGWRPDAFEVLIKIPLQYPDQKPDLIFVQPDAIGPTGGIPRYMSAQIPADNKSWAQVSWHLIEPFDPNADNLLGFARSVRLYLSRPNP